MIIIFYELSTLYCTITGSDPLQNATFNESHDIIRNNGVRNSDQYTGLCSCVTHFLLTFALASTANNKLREACVSGSSVRESVGPLTPIVRDEIPSYLVEGFQ